MHDDPNWLVIPQRMQYKLDVTAHCCLWHQAPWYLTDYCAPVFEVPGHQHLPDVINCQFRKFAAALLGPMRFLLPDQVWNSLPDHLHDPAVDYKQFRWDLKTYLFAGIQSVSALEVLRNHALLIDIYLLY